ncbi:CaiB/BaiF CoA transferase family protein [Salinarimonas ramus]|uniref:CoA transferase n=1 Tax=Salinarimonas ramus TaxID=690164 RepID=A0A917QH20_9HYPH|nr:CaiB/BaiF CoA-transferase family protein [Salinarimonas ramus]GGK50106.1 CoA transferase [Salinarimonas ramus]
MPASRSSSRPLPLSGITILDLSTLLPGPLATLILAEAGARVIKVERPGGEDMRRFPPMREGRSLAYAMLNAGKEIVELDLKDASERPRLEALIREADVLVEQMRPGVMGRLGLGPDALHAINPRLVVCSITGYGQDGPRAQEAGHDINYQALTGLLSLAPGSPEHPATPAALVADIAGGSLPAVIDILLALRLREITGEGSHLDVAMTDAMATFAWLARAELEATGRPPAPHGGLLTGGSPRYGLYATADGRYLALGALEDKFWARACAGLGLEPALADDTRDPAATKAAVAAIVRSRDAAHWRAVLEPLDCCATVVRTLDEAAADPHFAARGLFRARAETEGRQMPRADVPLAAALRRDAGESPG